MIERDVIGSELKRRRGVWKRYFDVKTTKRRNLNSDDREVPHFRQTRQDAPRKHHPRQSRAPLPLRARGPPLRQALLQAPQEDPERARRHSRRAQLPLGGHQDQNSPPQVRREARLERPPRRVRAHHRRGLRRHPRARIPQRHGRPGRHRGEEAPHRPPARL